MNIKALSYLIVFLTILNFSCSGSKEKSIRDLMTIKNINSYINASDNKIVRKSYNTMGPVLFSHTLHENNNINCNVCHHKKNNPSRIKTCSWCHKGLIPGAKKVHDFCDSCHIKKNGPQKCSSCHKSSKAKLPHNDISKMFKNTYSFTKKQHNYHKKLTDSCDKCHHREKTPKKKCSQCHSDQSRTRTMHIFCRDCHKEMKSGPIGCIECHKVSEKNKSKLVQSVVLQKTGHRKPSITFNHKSHMEDYNAECTDCHHKGSLKKCSECHLKKDMGKVINLKGAFHQQCHDCHRKTAGPKACKLCHKKSK